MLSSVVMGIGLHAVGGIAAAACYVPQKGTSGWSYQTFWLLFCLAGWFVVPVTVALLTIPNIGQILSDTPVDAMIDTTLLGAVYGFGGMAFALGIRHIGFSLTYAIAIGISAVLGTVVPAMLAGTLVTGFMEPGGLVVLTGFIVSIAGVAVCGWAGVCKERELRNAHPGEAQVFNIRKGLVLVVIAGVLSAVFGLALSAGTPIDEAVVRSGVVNFQGHLKYVFAMGGAFLTNLVWWGIVHAREGTFGEYLVQPANKAEKGRLAVYYSLGLLSGVLWYGQFFFYGLGHIRMGDFAFISWGIHMTMLVFFSFGIGYLFREWRGLSRQTTRILYGGLVTLLTSFCVITYGSWVGAAGQG